ncbi:MAG: bacillolysin, partial [uncultured bacterium]
MHILKTNINYRNCLITLLICIIFSSIRVIAATSDNQVLLNDTQDKNYQTLKTTVSNFFGSTNQAFSVPNFLYGEPLFKPKNSEDNYEQTISDFFQTYPDLFQVSINDFRVEVEKLKDRNITQVHLFQKYQNVPVFGAELIFTFNDKNELISYLGKYIPHISVDVKSTITTTTVKNIVAQDLKLKVVAQEPSLFVFNKGVLTDTKENTQLIWRLATNSWIYFVNANTGKMVYKYEANENVLDREVYTAGGGTPTLPGTSVISEGDDISTITDDDAKAAYIDLT